MSTQIRLLADRVLVKVTSEAEGKTAAGIIIPVTESEEKPQQGEVVRVSKRVEDCDREEDKVFVGETVLFSKFAGSDIHLQGVAYKLLRITDIMGAVEP